ncbi:MAG: flavodoxin family protein [Oscillospiraceae bacterium]|nr:flavodoxin family protein [Oscillospiraceae bacterium]
MKVLLLNGSPHEKGCTYTALMEVRKTLEKQGIETELLWLGTKPVAGCIACGKCSSGHCIYQDGVNDIADRLDTIDGIVVGSPVYYSGASGQVTAFLDRLFYVCGKRMAGKVAASVVSCRRGGATATFQQLNQYFAMSNMPIVTSQYWNQVHGSKAEDVLQDEEGLQTMRTLGENMAWLLKCIQAGRAAGVPEPIYEPVIRTNYIR